MSLPSSSSNQNMEAGKEIKQLTNNLFIHLVFRNGLCANKQNGAGVASSKSSIFLFLIIIPIRYNLQFVYFNPFFHWVVWIILQPILCSKSSKFSFFFALIQDWVIIAWVSNFFYEFCCVKDLRKKLVGTVCSPVMYGLKVHTLTTFKTLVQW